MRKAIERRLAAVERRLSRGRADLEVIVIRGGLHDGDPTFSTIGDVQMDRAPDESLAAFEARVVAEATAIGQEIVTMGGLPDNIGEQTSRASLTVTEDEDLPPLVLEVRRPGSDT
jgi:hypothetical protein